MKALIVSDNHGDLASLEELLEIYEESIDLWLHCGDSEFMAEHPIWNDFKTVKGNMDIEASLPAYRVENFGDEKILVVHGHQQGVDRQLESLKDLADQEGATIAFYGHTHRAQVDQLGDKYLVNPGSIAQPRGNFPLGTYAIYEKTADKRTLSFYDWNHNYLANLSVDLG